jgi:hypothetical protein
MKAKMLLEPVSLERHFLALPLIIYAIARLMGRATILSYRHLQPAASESTEAIMIFSTLPFYSLLTYVGATDAAGTIATVARQRIGPRTVNNYSPAARAYCRYMRH